MILIFEHFIYFQVAYFSLPLSPHNFCLQKVYLKFINIHKYLILSIHRIVYFLYLCMLLCNI